jgi:hypothetical protein
MYTWVVGAPFKARRHTISTGNTDPIVTSNTLL